jgi:hypothetical protein
MRTIKSVVLALTLLVGTTLFATNPIEVKVNKDQAAQEIAHLLENPNFEFEDGTEVSITLVVNQQGVLEVLRVSSENRGAEKFIQERLENQKIESTLEAGQVYKLPVTFNSVS